MMAAVRFLLLLLIINSLSLLPTFSFSRSDADSLLELKKSLQGDLDSWKPGSIPCVDKWDGVMCSGTNIIGLHLVGLHLTGTVNVKALLQVRGLRTISLVKNSFTGPIPEFNKLASLRAMYLSHNRFNEEIPKDYFASMVTLKKVWIDDNKFTGNIPDSLMKLPHLVELHLDHNQFSGTIPPLEYQDTVTSLDLSHNNLEGEIPESFSKFNASAFKGNARLCGKKLGKDCSSVQKSEDSTHSQGDSDSDSSSHAVLSIAALIIIVLVVLFAIISARFKREDDFSQQSKEPLKGEMLAIVDVPESSLRPRLLQSRRNGGAGKGRREVVIVNDEKGAFKLQDLMKAPAEVLKSGGFGYAYKAVMSNGLAVVVKRLKEFNKMRKDEFDAELKRMGKLKHPNVLTPLAYHFRREEKLIVSEYMPNGSLLYVLHGDGGTINANLNWPTRLKIIKGIAQGLTFIHTEFASYDIPHGNLKSSNVLLDENYDPKISDYAFQPLINSASAIKGLFAYKSPEYIQNLKISPKSDVYCLGILIIEIITRKFPSQYLNNAKDGGIDTVQWVQNLIHENQLEELIDFLIESDLKSIQQMVELLRIGAACTESNPNQRLDLKEVVRRIDEVN